VRKCDHLVPIVAEEAHVASKLPRHARSSFGLVTPCQLADGITDNVRDLPEDGVPRRERTIMDEKLFEPVEHAKKRIQENQARAEIRRRFGIDPRSPKPTTFPLPRSEEAA